MGAGDTGSLHHTCFVVRDLETTARTLAASLGVTWSVWTIEPVRGTVRGVEMPYSFRVAIAPVGDSNLELLQPLTGASVYVEHLASRGEGFHHTCIAYPSQEAMRGAREELERHGWEAIQTGDLGEIGEFCYFQIPRTDAVLELLYLAELPPPEATIGAAPTP
jgi:hypothetical protein